MSGSSKQTPDSSHHTRVHSSVTAIARSTSRCQAQAQPPISLFRTVVLAGVSRVTDNVGCASHGCTEFRSPNGGSGSKNAAVRVATRASGPSTGITAEPSAGAPRASHGPPQGGDDLYDNGPINGNVDAWTINFGFVVSDTITVATAAASTGMTFGAWLFPGDTLDLG